MLKLFKRLWQEEDGQGMVEYAIILALIALVVILALTPLGNTIKGLFTNAKNTIDQQTGGGTP